MLTDGLQLLGASTAENFTIDSGASLPSTNNNLGELYYLTTGSIGLYVYNGTAWEKAGAEVLTSAAVATALGYTPAALSNGKILSSQLPAIAITDTFVVTSQAAMLALSTAETGDVAVRTDLNKTFILKGTSASTLADWQELLSPTDVVTSVNGQTGTVSLSTANIAEVTNLYFTNARARAAISLTAGSSGATYNPSTGVLDLSTLSAGGATVAGSNTQIQYNNAGALGASSKFAWDDTTNVLTVGPSVITSGNFVTIAPPDGAQNAFVATSLVVKAGSSLNATSSNAGTLSLFGGNIVGANNGATNGGSVTIRGGDTAVANGSAQGGFVNIGGGLSTAGGFGGYVSISTAPSTTLVERLRILAGGAWSVGSTGSATGTAGQVLTSQGAAAAPTWTTVSGGGGASATSLQATAASGVTTSTTGTYIGSASGRTAINIIQQTANADQKAWNITIPSGTSGTLQFNMLPDALSAEVPWMSVARSGTTATAITLTATAIDHIGLTSGFKINGSAGTAGQVLTSQGAAAAPTWTAASVTALSGTATVNLTSATTGAFAAVSGNPYFALVNAGAGAGLKASYVDVSTAGTITWKLIDDAIATPVTYMSVARSGTTASLITLTSTGLNLATGTGGLQLNGSAGTAGQVLTSQGAAAAPTWSAAGATTSLNGTATAALDTATTALRAGTSSSEPYLSFTNATAAADNRLSTVRVNTSGGLRWTFNTDANAETNWLTVTRSGMTASLITLTGTGVNLTVGTSGLQLNGAVGTAGQVLTSQGAGAAPIWGSGGTAAAGGLTGTTLAANVVNSSLALVQPPNVATAGTTLVLQGGTSTGTGAFAGGLVSILGGTAGSSGNGGAISLTGGQGLISGAGGAITLTSGNGGGTSGSGGAITVLTGSNTSGTSGNTSGVLSLRTGNSVAGFNSGAITIASGNAQGFTPSFSGNINITTGGNSDAALSTTSGTIALSTTNGFGASGSSGNITLTTGTGTAGVGSVSISTAATVRLQILGNGAWSVGTGGAATGTAGQVLTSAGNAAVPTWASISATANASTLGTTVNGALSITGLAGTTSASSPMTISAPSTTTGQGNSLTLNAGTGTGQGGAVSINAAVGNGASNGGALTLISGNSGAGATGNGGAFSVTAGSSAATAGNGGAITLTSGNASGTGTPGSITLSAGQASATQTANGKSGSILIQAASAPSSTVFGGSVAIASGAGNQSYQGVLDLIALNDGIVHGAIRYRAGTTTTNAQVHWQIGSTNTVSTFDFQAMLNGFAVRGADAASGINLTVRGGDGTVGAGAPLIVRGGNGTTTGGTLSLLSGTSASGAGQNIIMTASDGGGAAAGGAIIITSGQGVGNFTGGAITLRASDSATATTAAGSNVNITAGSITGTGRGGSVIIKSGAGNVGNLHGPLILYAVDDGVIGSSISIRFGNNANGVEYWKFGSNDSTFLGNGHLIGTANNMAVRGNDAVTGLNFVVRGGDGSTGSGGALTVRGGDNTTTSGAGGAVTVRAGNGVTTGAALTIAGGTGGTTNGDIIIQTGGVERQRITGAGVVTIAAPTVTLSSNGSMLIVGNTTTTGVPSTTTRSAGTRVVFYPALSGTEVDFASGVEPGNMWTSFPGTLPHKWYSGTTNVMTMAAGGGTLTFTGSMVAASLVPSSATVPTNGLYLPAANTLGFSSNTTSRMTINSTGVIATAVGTSMDLGSRKTDVNTTGAAAATINLDLLLGNNYTLTMGANITSLTFTNNPASGRVYTVKLFLTQDATGGRTITWPAAVRWPGGTAPTLSGANKTDIIELVTKDGGVIWFGEIIGLNY